ncbi:MAG: ATP-binding protein [Bacteroidota bacterium]|nr:ATP-binding protein [Bacteroidota bacterium]MDP4226002.1 ATP-binding protein [Bacteroidota bacterium]MDP4274454.1 ATP-binding protein [Bacteroidota bacterium]
MKSLSTKSIALILSFLATLLAGLVFIFPEILGFNSYFFKFSVLLFFFLLIYLLARSLVDDFIKKRLKSAEDIKSKQAQKKKLQKFSVQDDVYTSEVKQDKSSWRIEKTAEIDQLKKLEQYRKDFIGNVSHELKTPIFNIQGYVLTLLEGGINDKKVNKLYLERMAKSVDRMISIVEDLESISRLESGELKLEMENFNILKLTEEIFELHDMRAKKHNIQLEFDKKYDRSVKVFADRQRISELMNNLVANAIKYGKKNGKVTLSFNPKGDKVLIEVRDNGIGIPENEISRIFERFYRVDKSRSREQGGTGLGLAIVKHIIEAHGQTITVKSKLNEGSVFSFTLDKAKTKQ